MKVTSIVTIFTIFAHTTTAVNSKRLDVLDAIQVENNSYEKRAGELMQTVELKIAHQILPAPLILRFGWSQANLKFTVGSGEFELSTTPSGGEYMEVQGLGDDDIPGATNFNVDIGDMTAVLEYEKGTGKLLSFEPDQGQASSIDISDSATGDNVWVTPTATILDGVPRPPG